MPQTADIEPETQVTTLGFNSKSKSQKYSFYDLNDEA